MTTTTTARRDGAWSREWYASASTTSTAVDRAGFDAGHREVAAERHDHDAGTRDDPGDPDSRARTV